MNYGRYEVVKELSREGGMGVVFLAHDPNLDMPVALKVMRQEWVSSEELISRFVDEARALGRLDHPSIVRVYNADEDNGVVYIVMEFIEGGSILEAMEKKYFGPKDIARLGADIAEALDYAHQRGIIHRDIKPSNILIRKDGRVKITDFGIAHIEDLKKTEVGVTLGTPPYMSPEQVKGQLLDGRSDLFSLGTVLYELSTGEKPFKGKTREGTFEAIRQDNPIEPAKINPSIPKGLSQIIMKCLKKKPEDRFSTGKALAQALKSFSDEKENIPPVIPWKKIVLALCVIIALTVTGYKIIPKIIPKIWPPNNKVNISSLKVESIPAGAHIFVDGLPKGKTPIDMKLPVGKHEFRLTLSGHHDWEAQIHMEKEEEPLLQIQLTPIEDKTLKDKEDSK